MSALVVYLSVCLSVRTCPAHVLCTVLEVRGGWRTLSILGTAGVSSCLSLSPTQV